MSIHQFPEGKQSWLLTDPVERAQRHLSAADAENLEKLAHGACAFAGKAVDRIGDRGLGKGILARAQTSGPFKQAEPKQELALRQGAVNMGARTSPKKY